MNISLLTVINLLEQEKYSLLGLFNMIMCVLGKKINVGVYEGMPYLLQSNSEWFIKKNLLIIYDTRLVFPLLV